MFLVTEGDGRSVCSDETQKKGKMQISQKMKVFERLKKFTANLL